MQVSVEPNRFMKEFCAPVDRLVEKIGNGSYSRTIAKISSWEQDEQTIGMLGLLNKCESEESRLKVVKDSTPIYNIFSVGTFEDNGKKCLGYLAEVMPSDNSSGASMAGSKGYDLYGSKECREFTIDPQDNNLFHPEVRPNGKLYGDYIVQNLKYDGQIPDHWNYKGKQYPFHSTKQRAGLIDPRLVGVWQPDAARCGALSDSYLMITADAFERYEDHCRIPVTAFFQGGLRGGLECSQEGEEYTQDIDVTVSSDETITFNGETYFKCADATSVP